MRDVGWGGVHNARDLGGLGAVRPGRVYRTGRLDGVTPAGWEALVAAGVRTIVDLRNDSEVVRIDIPAELARHHLPIEDEHDEAFLRDWLRVLNSPEVWPEVLRRWPELLIAVFRAIADAPEGGVLVHCSAGRDRTGLVTAMLLQLADVSEADIVADYLEAVRAANAQLLAQPTTQREPGRSPEDLAVWEQQVAAALRVFLRGTDVPGFLLDHGLEPPELERIRRRLLLPYS